MKNFLFYGVLFILSLSLVSCSTDDDDNNPNNNAAEISQVEAAAETGTWRITSYVDSGEDETNDFNGFDFTFETNGTVTATNGVTTYAGTWSVTGDSSSSNDDDDGSNDSDLDFNISFPVAATDDFEDLNDDWDIVSYTDNTINLVDVDDDNPNDTETLVFQRN